MIVKIDKLSHDLRGICKVDDKVTFISGVLPEEIVDVTLFNKNKKINEGYVKKIIKSSNDRTLSPCKYANECGGCGISYIEYQKGLEYKRMATIDILKKYANLSVNPNIIGSNNNYGYRNKISLKVDKGVLSLMKEKSNSFVNIDKCLLVNDKINNVIEILNNSDINLVSEVVIRGIDEISVMIKGEIVIDDIIKNLSSYVDSIILNGKVIYGNEYIKIKIKNYIYAVNYNSFFQVNVDMTTKLYDKILEYAGEGETLLDLYCGAGTIGIYLANNFKRVYGVEINKDAIVGANLNKKINNVDNIWFECKKANEIKDISASVIVVDPPRSGLDKKTINNLLNSNSKKIVYVSCNPITLARDIKLLEDKYTVEDITLFDMFPNTKHVESVCLLNYK